MDIIDQLFPPAKTDDTVAGLYQQGQQPWEILQSVHNETAHEVDFWREMKDNVPPAATTIKVEVTRK